MNSSYRPVKVDDIVDFKFKVGIEHQRIDVREARLGLTESNAFVPNLRYYFDLYGGNIIQVQLAIYLIFSYLKPKYTYDNKDILIRNLSEKDYSGDYSFDAVEDGLSLDLVSYYIVKSDVVKSIDEIRLDEWADLSREISSIINEILVTNRYKVLFNNVITSSVMKLLALPNLDSPDIFNQQSMFLNFSVINGSGFVNNDGNYRSVLCKRDNTL